ncbi:hypothetical protein GMYAFLOJ_CDS0059 [Microbacterium phage phiMiGM15]
MTAPTLRAIFDDKLTGADRLPLEEETALIARAQAGDFDAYNALLVQYAHGLRAMAEQEYARAAGHVDHDETRANVLLAFAEALHECQEGDRVAFRLPKATLRVADSHHLVGGFTIAERTRQRYMQARREAGPDGDAEAKARELGMTRETFLSVRDALDASSFDGILEEQGDSGMQAIGLERGYSTVEQRADVAKAFAAVDVITGDVIRDAYGFTEYDPIPDAEIAHRRGFSRSKVQRIRSEGLATMRKALNVPEVAE